MLKPGGKLTIVTDNLWYGRLLLRMMTDLQGDFQAMPLPNAVPNPNPICKVTSKLFRLQDEKHRRLSKVLLFS